MKVRFVLNNDFGNNHETSVEMNVEAIPRAGERIWIDNSQLFEKVFSIENNHVFHCNGISMYDTDFLIVCEIIHDYTEEDFGIYVELVYHYDRYLKDKYNTDDALSASSLDRT